MQYGKCVRSISICRRRDRRSRRDEDVVYVDPLEAEDGLPFAATELSKGKTIGVSVQTHANAFFLAEIDGVKATLEKGGIDAEVIAPDRQMISTHR